MAYLNTDLHVLFAKHNIRPFQIKLTRISKEGLDFKIVQLNLKTQSFFYLEYRTAQENTLLMRYNIQECYVKIARMDDHGKKNSLEKNNQFLSNTLFFV